MVTLSPSLQVLMNLVIVADGATFVSHCVGKLKEDPPRLHFIITGGTKLNFLIIRVTYRSQKQNIA